MEARGQSGVNWGAGAEVEQSKAHGQSKWGAGGAEWSRGKKKSRVEWKQRSRVEAQQALTPVYSQPSLLLTDCSSNTDCFQSHWNAALEENA